MDFSTVKTAGLTDEEVGQVIGVSRVMAWKYRTGKATPRVGEYRGVDLQDRCQVFLKILSALIAKGQLPKPELELTRNPDPEIVARRAAIVAKLRTLVDRHVVDARANT